MDIRQLKYFVSVFETLNFTQSSKDHFITQPALSKSIHALETELGVKFFERSSHGVAATEAGKAYYRHALNILAEVQRGSDRLKDIVTGNEGILRISTIPSLQKNVVDIISMFHKVYPNITIIIEVETGFEQIMSMSESKLDIYFSYRSLLSTNESLDYCPLAKERFCLFLPNEFIDSVTGDDFSALQNKKLLLERKIRGPYISNKIQEICISRGLELSDNIITLPNLTSVCLSVSAGIGFTVNPLSISKCYYMGNVNTIPITGDDAIIEYSVGWKNNGQNPSIQKFVEVMSAQHRIDIAAGRRPCAVFNA